MIYSANFAHCEQVDLTAGTDYGLIDCEFYIHTILRGKH